MGCIFNGTKIIYYQGCLKYYYNFYHITHATWTKIRRFKWTYLSPKVNTKKGYWVFRFYFLALKYFPIILYSKVIYGTSNWLYNFITFACIFRTGITMFFLFMIKKTYTLVKVEILAFFNVMHINYSNDIQHFKQDLINKKYRSNTKINIFKAI